MKIKRLRLKDKILISILPVIIIFLTLIAIISLSLAKQMLYKEYANQKEEVAANVINAVKLIDSGYRMLDRSIEDEMEQGILEFKAEFEAAGGDADTVSLEAIKAKMESKYDLIIIDENTTVIKSTLPEGLDFNFLEFDKALGEEINNIRLSEVIRHERIRTNVVTGFLSKFTYRATDDHQYLLEIAFSKGGLQSIIEELDPLKTVAQLKVINPIISDIRIFDAYGYEFVDSGVNYEPTAESLDIVAKAKEANKYETKDRNQDINYLFIDLNLKEQTMSDSSKVIEIVYDKTNLMNLLDRLSFIIYSVSLIVIVVIILIIAILSKKITYPITRLSVAAKKVALGDYDIIAEKTSKDEIGELTDLFNSMVEKIRENFEKIEKQKEELEGYSRNLENMVEERTLKLTRIIEESKKTHELLKESNLQFENLFNNMQEGFSIHEIICDDNGNPVNYKLLDSNKAFENYTKKNDLKNTAILELTPDTKLEWIQLCGKVALTGESHYIENYSSKSGKHFAINIFSPAKGKFATIFSDITNQVLSKEEIKKEKIILERILDGTLSGYWDWNLVNNTEYLSPGFKKMLGYEDNELVNTPETWQNLIFKEELPKVMECYKKHVESLGKVPFYNEVRYHHKDGSTLWVICSGYVVEWGSDNKPLQMVGSHINITDIKKLEKSLSDERELLKATLLSIGDGVITTDKYGMVEIVNAEAEELTGWSQEEALGRNFEDVFRIANEYTKHKCESPIEKVLKTGKTVEIADHTILIKKDGSEISIEDSAAPIKDENGNINGAVLIFRDFTEKKDKQERIEYLSFHDQLTGLYNRRYLEEELIRIDVPGNHPLTVVMLDVNGLKLINDAFGHKMGDKVLQNAAEIMKNECRQGDILARYGGDEFVILLPKTNSNEVDLLLKQMVAQFATESVGSINLSISYGWGTKQNDEESISDIFKIAEDHMYRRKLSESKSMRYRTVEIILKTLHEKSEREKIHSDQVSQICEGIGLALELESEDIRELKTVGLMHDIGKIAIDLSILDKPGKLNALERIEIERHPELGYQILRSINDFAKLAEYVLAHHERWDGTGYPGKLKEEEIPLEARIIAIADSYHAMTCDRPYRKAMSKEAALEEIERCAGTQFDPIIVKLFLEKVAKNL
ncbi:MAG: HD domain-containing phosphohydrolase [Mobilitalea sp.]